MPSEEVARSDGSLGSMNGSVLSLKRRKYIVPTNTTLNATKPRTRTAKGTIHDLVGASLLVASPYSNPPVK